MGDQMELGGPGTAMRRTEGEVTVPAEAVAVRDIMDLVKQGVDPDAVGKMVDLYVKVQGIQARQAFNQAMMNVRRYMDTHPVPCRGRNQVTKQGTVVPYPLLEDIQKVLDPVCAENDLRYSFDTEPNAHGVVVLLHIEHVMGHRETTRTAPLPMDTSGSKNATQGVGSTESYGMRYGIIKGFGLTRYLHDDDGAGGGSGKPEVKTVDKDELAALSAVWDEVKGSVGDQDAFMRGFVAYYNADSLATIPKSHYRQALQQLERKR